VLELFNALLTVELLSAKKVHSALRQWVCAISDRMFNPKPNFSDEDVGPMRDLALKAVREDLGVEASIDASIAQTPPGT